jgi:hypothetical protein
VKRRARRRCAIIGIIAPSLRQPTLDHLDEPLPQDVDLIVGQVA